jgi:3-dehydroquinate dehydratase
VILHAQVTVLSFVKEDFICQQVAHIRRYCGTPIIFTVRNRGQGLLFVVQLCFSFCIGSIFSGSGEKWLALLLLGVELCCDYIDAEVTLSDTSIAQISRKRRPRL